MDGGSESHKSDIVELKNQLYNRTCKEYIRTVLLELWQGPKSFCPFILVIATHSIGYPIRLSPVFPTHSLQIDCIGFFEPKSILWDKELKSGSYNNYHIRY